MAQMGSEFEFAQMKIAAAQGQLELRNQKPQ
jgi:hypothetical protein